MTDWISNRPPNPQPGDTHTYNGVTYVYRKDAGQGVWDGPTTNPVTRAELEHLQARIEECCSGGGGGGSPKRYIVTENSQYQADCETAALEVYDALEDRVVPKYYRYPGWGGSSPHDDTLHVTSFGAKGGYALFVYYWALREGWVNNYKDKNPTHIASTAVSSMVSSQDWVKAFSGGQVGQTGSPHPHAYWDAVVDKLTTPAADGQETRKDRAERFVLSSIRQIYHGSDYPRMGKHTAGICANASGLGEADEYKGWVLSWVNWLNNAPKGTANHEYSI